MTLKLDPPISIHIFYEQQISKIANPPHVYVKKSMQINIPRRKCTDLLVFMLKEVKLFPTAAPTPSPHDVSFGFVPSAFSSFAMNLALNSILLVISQKIVSHLTHLKAESNI